MDQKVIDQRLIHVPTIHALKESPEVAKETWGVFFRSSARSLSGCVCDVDFPLVEQARACAAKWSQKIGVPVKVRFQGLFRVSVLVQKPSY